MTKNLHKSFLFKIFMLLTGLFLADTVYSQTIGNGQVLNASDAGPNVTIQAGGTLNMDIAKSFTAITSSGSGTSFINGLGVATVDNTVTIGAGNTLQVAPDLVTLNLVTATLNNQTATLSGTGNVDAGSITVNGTGSMSNANLSISAGITVQTGTVAGGSGASTFKTINLAGTLKISALTNAIQNISSFTFAVGSTVAFNGGNGQAVNNLSYYNLTLSGTGSKTFAGNRTITGNFLLETGASLSLGSNNLTIDVNGNRTATINGQLNINGNGRLQENNGGTKTLIVGSQGYINITGNTSLPVFNAYAFDAASTVEYGATVDQTITDVPSPGYGNLLISGNSNNDAKTALGALDIQGNLTISGSTFDADNFTHNLKGNWIRNGGGFTTGTGRINLSGSTAQTIGGSQSTSFERVTFSNTNGGVSLQMPTTITVNATFTDGIVTSDAANLLIFTDNATSSLTAANAGSTSYVSGPVRKIGNDDFTFPVGKAGTGFVPIRIEDVTNANTTFTAEYIRATPPNRTNITAAGIQNISKCEYWIIDRAAGTNSTADIIAYWNANNPCDAGPYVTQPATMRLVHYNGTSWNTASTGNGQGSAAAGSVSWGNVNTFSPFALGTTSATENPLPVVFGNVKAYEKNSGVQIEWSNLTEKDVAGYSVERSANGSDFSAIAQQLPASNQNDQADYTAFDAAPQTGTNYYRIKAVETTGKIVYSKVLSVKLGATAQRLSLYPNPVQGNQVNISLSNLKRGQYDLRVINAAGQDVLKQRLNSPGSNLTQTINLPASIAPGVYNLLIAGGDIRESKMFIVQ